MTPPLAPPPILVDVAGIEPRTPPDPPVDWPRLARLPAFQLFVDEENQAPVPDPEFWARVRARTIGEQAYYQVYADWHARKGLWPNETPMGVLK